MKTFRVLCLVGAICLSGSFLFADPVVSASTADGIVNQAAIGEVSHVSFDGSGQLRNATGTAATLVEPVGLAPLAPKRLQSGQTGEASAALAYDDGTFTRLSSDETSWTSNHQALQVDSDGMLEVGQVSERVRVRLTATAEGFSAEVLVRVDPLPEDESAHEPEPGKGPWPDATSLGVGWFQSQWFGSFHPTKNRWIYHDGLGWLYPSGDSPDNLWLWDQQQRWMWTNREVYPQLFRHHDQTWLYYMIEVKSQRIFFNYSTNQLEFE
ncbi:MAG: hypothetical protein CMI32_07110 [Opitutales bacterium]|nr:hypothetical protein [Opitutales bacterium]|tara:strand:+ start:206 stop:1006 length:801 start_codon:yes stop_codon:yes gene_type:complete